MMTKAKKITENETSIGIKHPFATNKYHGEKKILRTILYTIHTEIVTVYWNGGFKGERESRITLHPIKERIDYEVVKRTYSFSVVSPRWFNENNIKR